MLATLGKRLVTVIPTLIGVVIVTFLLTRVLPGDPAVYFAGPAATPQSIADIRKSLGLDRPLPEQFARYVSDLAHGNLGNSLSTGRPVVTEIKSRLPASAELTLPGLILSLAIAVPLGILAAVKQGSWIDHTCRVVATAGVSLPVFFTGLLLVYIFYYQLGWAPAPIGRLDAFTDAPSADHRLLPDRQPAHRQFRNLPRRLRPAAAAGLHARHLLAGADRAHDARLDARRARLRFRAHRARERPRQQDRHFHLRLPQRHAAGGDHARHGVLLPARRQRAGREGVRLARHRLLRGRGAAAIGLRAGAGLRAGDGDPLRGAQPRRSTCSTASSTRA